MALRDRSSSQPLWRRYLRFRGPDVRADVDDEIRFHVDMLTQENIEAGMDPESARSAALRRFGSIEGVEEECIHIGRESARMIRRTELLDLARWDVRHTVRGLLRAPGFALTTILVLALGIGAITVVFSVVNTVLLRPLPFAEPDRLVLLYETFPLAGGTSGEGSVSYPNFVDWKEQSRSYEDVAVTGWPRNVTLQGRGEPERLEVLEAGANLFSLLGAQPLVGRVFAPGEDAPEADPVIVLSERAWRSRFGAATDVLGSTLALDGTAYTVVGVMPERFRYPAGRAPVEGWVPLQVGPQQAQNRGSHNFAVLGRLRPGVSAGAAERELAGIAARLAQEYPDQQEGRSARVFELRERLVGNVRPTLLVLMGAAGLVLLIAVGNAASLLLARAVSRRREVAIRAALGAGRGRLVRQFLTESLLLSLCGALLGLALAWGGVRAIAISATQLFPRATELSLDVRVIGFLAVVSLLTGVAFGLGPAMQASRTDLQTSLREGGRGGTGGRAGGAFRAALVVVQVSLSIVLLVGAGLLMRSFLALQGTDTGMRTENVLTMRVTLADDRYPDADAALQRFYLPMLERVRGLPGVEAAGLINMLPIREYGSNGNLGIAGRSYASVGEQPFAEFRVTSPGLFAALGVPVVRGRDVLPSDAQDAPPVALVNQRFVERYLPDVDPIGQQLTDLGPEPVTIVGVVGTVRQSGIDQEPRAEVHFPFSQTGAWGLVPMTLVVRTGVEPASVARAVQAQIRSVDPDMPIFDVKTMEQVVSESVSYRRLYLWLLGAFAAVAMALAVAGIFGVISYSVSQRTREFGIRLALGSGVQRVRRMVVWQGGRLALLGVLIGLPCAWLATRLLASLLYGVGTADAVTYVAVAMVLSGVALLASYVPARRATRVDPVVSLRAAD